MSHHLGVGCATLGCSRAQAIFPIFRSVAPYPKPADSAGAAADPFQTKDNKQVRQERAPSLLACAIPESWRHSSTSHTPRKRRRILLLDHQVEREGGAALTQDDALYRFRLRALALATELGNVRAACRAMGIHPSTFYRWRS
jgi:hypothetical protein